jgi:hypothetical protein
MYIYDFVNKFGKKVEKKSSNGTKLSVVKSRQITMKHYKKIYNFEDRKVYRTQNTIRSYKHALYAFEKNKKVLSSFDDKRFICVDKINTLPWGHYLLERVKLLYELTRYFKYKLLINRLNVKT